MAWGEVEVVIEFASVADAQRAPSGLVSATAIDEETLNTVDKFFDNKIIPWLAKQGIIIE